MQATSPEPDDVRWVGAATLLGGALAWVYFALRSPMPVLVGLEPIGAWVPAHYQASAFPAFAGSAAALALDLRGRAPAARWLPRGLVLAATAALGVIRLGGHIPLSGHAIYLAAQALYDLSGGEGRRGKLLGAASAGGLVITAYYKIHHWHDPYLLPSLALGALLGGGGALLRWKSRG